MTSGRSMKQISKILSARITSEKRELEKRWRFSIAASRGQMLRSPTTPTVRPDVNTRGSFQSIASSDSVRNIGRGRGKQPRWLACCHKNGSQNRRFHDPRSGRSKATPEGVKPDLVRCFICFASRSRRMSGPFLDRSCDCWSAPIP